MLKVLLWTMLSAGVGCESGPKEITAEDDGQAAPSQSTGIFSNGGQQAPAGMVDPAAEKDLHTVTALEALPTSKYVYVRVKEGEDEYWVAATLQAISIGQSYFFRGGLQKTDFVSKEYNRTFDRLLLISQLVPANHGSSMGAMETGGPSIATAPSSEPLPQLDVPGSIRIKDVVTDPKRYAGKMVQVSGTCTKVNPNIMGRNWVHLNDGGKDAKELVITTNEIVAEGQPVTMIGRIVVDQDFSAGYKYDVLMEQARVVR
mgnify:FL=1